MVLAIGLAASVAALRVKGGSDEQVKAISMRREERLQGMSGLKR
jgi:hypothetical protein